MSTADDNCLQWPPIVAAVSPVTEDMQILSFDMGGVCVACLMTVLNYSNHFSESLVKTLSIRPHSSTPFRLRYSVGLGQSMTSFMKTDTSQTHSLRQSGSSLLINARLHADAVAVAD